MKIKYPLRTYLKWKITGFAFVVTRVMGRLETFLNPCQTRYKKGLKKNGKVKHNRAHFFFIKHSERRNYLP